MCNETDNVVTYDNSVNTINQTEKTSNGIPPEKKNTNSRNASLVFPEQQQNLNYKEPTIAKENIFEDKDLSPLTD